jgi:hypothetical protein
MEANTIKVYEILKLNFSEEKATTVLSYLENTTSEKIDEKIKTKIEHIATKEDLFKLEPLISEKYANTIKWLFLFWISTIGTIIALIKLL